MVEQSELQWAWVISLLCLLVRWNTCGYPSGSSARCLELCGPGDIQHPRMSSPPGSPEQQRLYLHNPCTAFSVSLQKDSDSAGFCPIFSALLSELGATLHYSCIPHACKSRYYRQYQVMGSTQMVASFYFTFYTVRTAFEWRHGWTWENMSFSSPVAAGDSLLKTLCSDIVIPTHLQNICDFMSGSLPWTMPSFLWSPGIVPHFCWLSQSLQQPLQLGLYPLWWLVLCQLVACQGHLGRGSLS